MSTRRAARVRRGRDAERLLRWYPRSWRTRHGAVLLGTWQDLAESRGSAGLTRAEAWSMRVHGVAERLDLAAAVGLAVAGLVCALLGLVGVFGFLEAPDGQSVAVWRPLAQVLSSGVGPALVSLSAVALLRAGGVLGAAGSVGAALSSTLAWALAAASTVSWSLGFDRADAGLPQSAFTGALPVLLAAAVALGALALAPAWDALLRGVRARWLRRMLAISCAAPTAVVIGVSSINPVVWPMVSVGLLVAGHELTERRSTRPAPAVPVITTATVTVAETDSAAVDGRATPALRRRVAILSSISAALGLSCTTYALFEAPFAPLFVALVDRVGLAGLPAMNTGLAAGAVAAIPLVVALGLLATHRWGRRLSASAAAVVAALAMSCIGQAQGPDGSFAPLLAAAMLTALAVVHPFTAHLPGGRLGRWALAALICTAVSWAGLPLVVAFPLFAPLLAVSVALWAAGAPRFNARAVATAQHPA